MVASAESVQKRATAPTSESASLWNAPTAAVARISVAPKSIMRARLAGRHALFAATHSRNTTKQLHTDAGSPPSCGRKRTQGIKLGWGGCTARFSLA